MHAVLSLIQLAGITSGASESTKIHNTHTRFNGQFPGEPG